MERYEHGGDIYGNPGVRLDFSVNINPLGMPDAVRQALIFHIDEYTLYPDPQCRELCASIAMHENVPDDWVLCGNGAADLIYRLCYAIKPCKALVCSPTFSEYERALEQVGCQVTRHILSAENEFALTANIALLLTPDIDILFLCHPNNPTGRLIPEDLMGRIIAKANHNNTIIVVDECFLDFTDGVSAKQHLINTPGLVVLKAFTKMYAMAGLRLGYLLASNSVLLNKINNSAQSWSVSVPAQVAGISALTCTDWVGRTRRLVEDERRFLLESLTDLGITAFPSDANYLLLKSERLLYEPLLQKRILIRSCTNFRGLDNSYYRVGIKTRDENTCLIQAIKETDNG